jgi:WD40 repeat protein
VLRYLFGDDIFISYSRKDGANYAAALASELSRRSPELGFSCFLDQWGASAGAELSKPVVRALRRSSVLVLIGTPGALESVFVKKEIADFTGESWRRGHRPILPININGALDGLEWEALTGLVRTPETEEARRTGVPSPEVIRLIANSGSYTKRNERVRWFSIAALLLLVAAIGASATAWQQSRRAVVESARATESAQVAKKQTELAARRQAEATESTRKADEKQKEADSSKREATNAAAQASAFAFRAHKSAEAAQAQTRIAQQNARIARSQEIASLAVVQRDVDPDLSLALNAEALAVAPTAQAVESLRTILAGVPMLAVMRTDSELMDAAYSADGKSIVMVGSRGLISFWDPATRREMRRITGGSSYIIGAAFSPDGQQVVATEDYSARIWRVATGELVRELKRDMSGVIKDVVFSADGKHVAVVELGRLQIWRAATGEVVKDEETCGRAAAFSPDGTLVAAECAQHRVRVWPIGGREPVAELHGHAGQLQSIRFSHDGQFLVTTSLDKTARIWRSGTGELIRTLQGHRDFVFDAAFSPNDELVVTASDRTVRVFRAADGERIRELRGHRSAVTSAEFSPDGRFILTASRDGTARLWPTVLPPIARELDLDASSVHNVAFSPDSQFFATASLDATRIWSTARREVVAELPGGAASVAFSPDGRSIAVGGSAGVVKVWRAGTREELGQFKADSSGVNNLSYSLDGRFIVTAGYYEATLWDASTLKAIGNLGDDGNVRAAGFSPDGRFIVTAGDDDQDNEFGDTIEGGRVMIWNARTRAPVAELAGHESHVNSAVYSPDGEFILTGCRDAKVRIWRAATQELVRVIEDNFQGTDLNAAYSGDGRLVVTAGGLKPPKVWSAATGEYVAELKERTAWGDHAAFSPDGQWLITAGDVAALWPRVLFMPQDELRERLAMLSPRVLNYGERKEHLRENRD